MEGNEIEVGAEVDGLRRDGRDYSWRKRDKSDALTARLGEDDYTDPTPPSFALISGCST